jgi:large subunit ribosomal protein L5
LKEIYEKEIVPSLMKQFQYPSIMQVPSLKKIVVNVGMGEAIQTPKILDSAVEELAQITGQRPVVTQAKKSIANFKLREGMAVGCKVTLRKRMMYEFLDRLINTSLPRIRDFRGISGKAFDGRGNYSLGLTEQMIFPEIKFDKVEKIHGMDIVIVTTAKNDEEAKALLNGFRMPFRN